MSDDPLRGAPGTNPPRHQPVDGAATLGWTFVGIALAVIVAGVAMYNARSTPADRGTPTAANPAAVTIGAPRVPPMIQDETTGQTAPR
jgi:hypothetical protein